MDIPTFDQLARVAPISAITMGIVGLTVWGTLRVIRFTKEMFMDKDEKD